MLHAVSLGLIGIFKTDALTFTLDGLKKKKQLLTWH
jgi:hypothetical protein